MNLRPRLLFFDEGDKGSKPNEAENLENQQTVDPVEQEKAKRQEQFNARIANSNKKKLADMQSFTDDLTEKYDTLLAKVETLTSEESTKTNKGGRPPSEQTQMDDIKDLLLSKMDDLGKTMNNRITEMHDGFVEERKRNHHMEVLRDAMGVSPEFQKLYQGGFLNIPDSFFDADGFDKLDGLIESMNGRRKENGQIPATETVTTTNGKTVTKSVPHRDDKGQTLTVQNDPKQKTGIHETVEAIQSSIDEKLGTPGDLNAEFGKTGVKKELEEIFKLSEQLEALSQE